MKTTKRLLSGLLLGLVLVSCTPEPVEVAPVKDCNCDRVAYILTQDTQYGGPGQPVNFTTPGTFITINDCSGVQLTKTGYAASIGQCRK